MGAGCTTLCRCLAPRARRAQLARTLRSAYADGLLSDGTFSHPLELLLADRLVDPARVAGDLNMRSPGRRWVAGAVDVLRRPGLPFAGRRAEPIRLPALDRTAATSSF